MKELIEIQKTLKAPKKHKNTYGNYNYRTCEDILEAVKPLAAGQGCSLIISDELVLMGGRFYVRATARLRNQEGEVEEAVAYAREAEVKKGMDDSQITGSASSYARKYALNGLFAIDDTRDADAEADAETKPAVAKPAVTGTDSEMAVEMIAACGTMKDLLDLYNSSPLLRDNKAFMDALAARKRELRAKRERETKQERRDA